MTPDQLAELLVILTEDQDIAWEDLAKITGKLFAKTRFTK